VWWRDRGLDGPVIVCLPPAGSGCGQFRGWQERLGEQACVVGVQLPGREERWADPVPSTIDEAIAAVADEVRREVPPDRPVVVFGHSFGGLLGYEVTRRLEGAGVPVRGLVVAACRPPHLWVGAGRGLVDDANELARLLAARGLGADELDEDSRELMLDVLRQDAQLSLSYRGGAGELACGLEAWGGDGDPMVSPAQLDGWARYAGSTFRRRQFPGGHYFHLTELDRILPRLVGLVEQPSSDERSLRCPAVPSTSPLT